MCLAAELRTSKASGIGIVLKLPGSPFVFHLHVGAVEVGDEVPRGAGGEAAKDSRDLHIDLMSKVEYNHISMSNKRCKYTSRNACVCCALCVLCSFLQIHVLMYEWLTLEDRMGRIMMILWRILPVQTHAFTDLSLRLTCCQNRRSSSDFREADITTSSSCSRHGRRNRPHRAGRRNDVPEEWRPADDAVHGLPRRKRQGV